VKRLTKSSISEIRLQTHMANDKHPCLLVQTTRNLRHNTSTFRPRPRLLSIHTTSKSTQQAHQHNMTTRPTMPAGLQGPPSVIQMQHLPLYGILVSERSFFIGMRSQALQHHAHSLSHRVAGPRLPPELCDSISADLLTLLQDDARNLWETTDPADRASKFMYGDPPTLTNSQLAGQRLYGRIAKHETADGIVGIRATGVCVDVLGGAAGEKQRYVHLSASLARPNICGMVPGETAAGGGGGPGLSFGDGRMVATNQRDSDTQLSREQVSIHFQNGEIGGAKRLLQFDDLNTSIRGWNQGLIEAFVLELGLKVIDRRGVRGGEGIGGVIEPEFMMMQELKWLT
jgi:hypothetical protein